MKYWSTWPEPLELIFDKIFIDTCEMSGRARANVAVFWRIVWKSKKYESGYLETRIELGSMKSRDIVN